MSGLCTMVHCIAFTELFSCHVLVISMFLTLESCCKGSAGVQHEWNIPEACESVSLESVLTRVSFSSLTPLVSWYEQLVKNGHLVICHLAQRVEIENWITAANCSLLENGMGFVIGLVLPFCCVMDMRWQFTVLFIVICGITIYLIFGVWKSVYV